jgi:hypothetical protein
MQVHDSGFGMRIDPMNHEKFLREMEDDSIHCLDECRIKGAFKCETFFRKYLGELKHIIIRQERIINEMHDRLQAPR